jgi:predicted lactoylglutathione lyase
MNKMIFVTLPVSDMYRSRRFYEALGWTINDAFSSDTSACVVVSDAIYFMLATHDAFAAQSAKPLVLPRDGASALIALSCEARDEVDAMTDAAVAAGGASLHEAEDLGFMYSRAFADPDGNGFGPFWMAPAAGN